MNTQENCTIIPLQTPTNPWSLSRGLPSVGQTPTEPTVGQCPSSTQPYHSPRPMHAQRQHAATLQHHQDHLFHCSDTQKPTMLSPKTLCKQKVYHKEVWSAWHNTCQAGQRRHAMGSTHTKRTTCKSLTVLVHATCWGPYMPGQRQHTDTSRCCLGYKHHRTLPDTS